MKINRLTTWKDQNSLTAQSINTEFQNIINIFNGHNSGQYTWDNFKVNTFSTVTPTLAGFGAVSQTAFRWKIIDDLVLAWGLWKNGTVSGDVASISLPASYPINFSKLSSVQNVVGTWTLSKSEAISSLDDHGALATDGSTTGFVYFSRTGSGGNKLPKEVGSSVGQNNSYMFVQFSYLF
jgi:hypothetical protein